MELFILILSALLLLISIIFFIIIYNGIRSNRRAIDRIKEEIWESNSSLKEIMNLQFDSTEKLLSDKILLIDKGIDERLNNIEKSQQQLSQQTKERLSIIQTTVDEKLEKTLNERISKSFELVGKQLVEVQKGLGEMHSLAQDVGGLKRVLSNVKMRGGFGEIQLSLLLEQLLAPGQYESNVRTKSTGNNFVEFAIKLPGNGTNDSVVWLPIDAKFPKDVYENLLDAYDASDTTLIESSQKALYDAVRRCAKDISEKYIEVPNTTDFAIMFLPFEGIFAEVVRSASFLQEIQNKYKIIVTGPTTLAAILNSLQIGFRTLAIQKRSGEVWQILGAVKSEFSKFGGLIDKAQKKIKSGIDDLDDLVGVRTRQIENRLKEIESVDEVTASRLLNDTIPYLSEKNSVEE
ncbi:MAG: DNA recombination protein RmuC [Bacteroidales bacterium]|nr:DNA recombination protein RmuC [Bacteroidales bacterium]